MKASYVKALEGFPASSEECPGGELCDICGKSGARIRRVSRCYGRGADLLVVENIPVVSCQHCGESYMTAETLREIELVKLHRKDLAKEGNVAVVAFEQAGEEQEAQHANPA